VLITSPSIERWWLQSATPTAKDRAMTNWAGDLFERIGGWSDLLLDEECLDEALDVALVVSRRTIGGDHALSLTVRPRNGSGASTRAATDPVAQRLDEWQYEHGEGPCITSDRERALCAVNDLATDDTFPGFAAVAIGAGIHGVASFPLLARDVSIGSLNIFYPQRGRVDDQVIALGRQLAATLSPMLANFLTHQATLELTAAFELLSTQSQHDNRKVRDVAAALLEGHERDSTPRG